MLYLISLYCVIWYSPFSFFQAAFSSTTGVVTISKQGCKKIAVTTDGVSWNTVAVPDFKIDSACQYMSLTYEKIPQPENTDESQSHHRFILRKNCGAPSFSHTAFGLQSFFNESYRSQDGITWESQIENDSEKVFSAFQFLLIENKVFAASLSNTSSVWSSDNLPANQKISDADLHLTDPCDFFSYDAVAAPIIDDQLFFVQKTETDLLPEESTSYLLATKNKNHQFECITLGMLPTAGRCYGHSLGGFILLGNDGHSYCAPSPLLLPSEPIISTAHDRNSPTENPNNPSDSSKGKDASRTPSKTTTKSSSWSIPPWVIYTAITATLIFCGAVGLCAAITDIGFCESCSICCGASSESATESLVGKTTINVVGRAYTTMENGVSFLIKEI